MEKREIGLLGEQYAENFLISQSYRPLRKNYHSIWGEVDLIMMSPEMEMVFVEVKARTNLRLGTAEQSITHRKIHCLIKTAMTFLMKNRQNDFVSWRIDLLALKLSRTGQVIDLKHYKNILNGI